jgi:uncharacterized cupin superfamily protein
MLTPSIMEPVMSKNILNINDLEYMDWGNDEKFSAKFGEISRRIGSKGLGYNLTVVPAGKRAFPFHSHRVNDEMFYIIEGNGEIRIGAETFPIRQGDIIACPPGGPETAHQIINNSDAELKYLAVSTTMSPEIAEYPDSDKTGAFIELGESESGMPEMWRIMVRNDSTRVDYWDGED